MSVNKYLPHVFVLPEDDANRQLANGFVLDPSVETRKIQILPEARGWENVLELFASDHVPEMDRYERRFMVLLIDFDNRDDRLNTVRRAIPDHLTERVFVLGVWNTPEALRSTLRRPYEAIGRAMATDCREGTDTIWNDDLLRHNTEELARLRRCIRPVLFPGS